VVTVTIVLDGAADPGDSSLGRARTPALDALAAAGTTAVRHTIPAGLPAGTETAMPVLLGWTPDRPVARGALEAAARGITVPEGEAAWRVDGVGAEDRGALGAAGFAVHELGRDRVLAVGRGVLPVLAAARVWSDGAVPPRVLDDRTVVVAAVGAASGVARLLGARVTVPTGATGDVDSDLPAKAAAARGALDGGAEHVVVHVGGPDAAGHRRDADGKVAAIEAADRDVVGPLHAALRGRSAVLEVGADHGCDPLTGRHDDAPVAWVRWAA
jgi:2,3-bisphosphoglycerate-independent phosphoglycerate mutase